MCVRRGAAWQVDHSMHSRKIGAANPGNSPGYPIALIMEDPPQQSRASSRSRPTGKKVGDSWRTWLSAARGLVEYEYCRLGKVNMKFSWQANKKNLHCRGGGNGLSSEICQAPATGQRLLSLMASLSTLLLVTYLAGSVALAAQGADQPQAVTTSDPAIAKAELELLLGPLSK